ncbi:hypothetical protein PVAG01_07237 [Phlyctema vagabunda]|uniref:Centromere protein H C-terminal domain-containing protein n=1 Tax=Phlyctema vagabunda TaxID=108571 RepID=A0ABR4PBU3_9HELO
MAEMEEDEAAVMQGVEMTRDEDNDDQPLFTDDEKRVLELYDRLEELKLERAFLEAQGALSRDIQPHEASEQDIKRAQSELLEIKAKHSLRANVIESVIAANPILNAIHAGPNATMAEQDLLPLIEQRDALSLSLTELTSKLQAAQQELIKVKSDNIMIARQNAELAAKMIALAQDANTQKIEEIEDLKTRQEIEDLEQEVKSSRQKLRIMKETTSAIVVGSGVDWARDPKLLEIVLDDDGDD